MTVLRAALVATILLALPASARAGTVTRNASVIAYQATAGGDTVTLGVENGAPFVASTQGVSSANCPNANQDPNRVNCPATPAFQVTFADGDENNLDAREVANGMTVTANGANTNDRLTGSPNADTLNGNAGDDNLTGGAGNDILNGGPGANFYDDGPGNDAVIGGPNNDTWIAGPGADTFTPGDGTDSVSYEGHGAPVTITFNGAADDGEAGESDNVGADAEEATGGNGNDVIVGNDLGDRLHGGPGNDTITGGKGEDRLEGNEGDDTIDARDGRYDSIDCGPGNDVVYADLTDSTENCEVAPDVDGDGTPNAQDCNPNDPAIHPGAPEIYGNAVDENCDGVRGYLRVVSPVGYSTARDAKRNRMRFTRFLVQEVHAGDTVEIRCATKAKGCAFAKKKLTGKSKPTLNVLKYFKKRFLKKGAVVEIRTTRPNEIGAVRRLTVIKRGNIKSELLCLPPGTTKPGRCA